MAKTKKKPTRYPGVRYHGDVLYFRVQLAAGERKEIKFGLGTPRDAFRAREERQELENRIKAGLVDPLTHQAELHSARPVLELMEEYLDHLSAKGDSQAHIDNIERFIREGLQVCDFDRLLTIDPQKVNRWLADLTLSARSKNYRRIALLGFCRWAADYGRSPRNPLPSSLVPKFDENADRRRLSRAMSLTELGRLLDALLDADKLLGSYFGHNKRQAKAAKMRRAFYQLVANTGLRWGETSRLRWGDLHLDEGLVIVPAGQTKNGKRAELPLVNPVVDSLRELCPAEAGETERVFTSTPTLRTWKDDLKRAGILGENDEGYVDDRGRRLDRKCLRMSYCTWLKHAGVDLRDAQQLMRHSDPKLTSNVYTDFRLHDLRAAVEKIHAGPQGASSGTLAMIRTA